MYNWYENYISFFLLIFMCMCSVCIKICNWVFLLNSVKLCFNVGFFVYLLFMVILDIYMVLFFYKIVLFVVDL